MLRPNDLAVVVGVKIEKTGRYDFAARIDLFFSTLGNRPDVDDLAVANADIGLPGLCQRSVDNSSAAYDQIHHEPRQEWVRPWPPERRASAPLLAGAAAGR